MNEFRLWPLRLFIRFTDFSADTGTPWHGCTITDFDGRTKRGYARTRRKAITKALRSEWWTGE